MSTCCFLSYPLPQHDHDSTHKRDQVQLNSMLQRKKQIERSNYQTWNTRTNHLALPPHRPQNYPSSLEFTYHSKFSFTCTFTCQHPCQARKGTPWLQLHMNVSVVRLHKAHCMHVCRKSREVQVGNKGEGGGVLLALAKSKPCITRTYTLYARCLAKDSVGFVCTLCNWF